MNVQSQAIMMTEARTTDSNASNSAIVLAHNHGGDDAEYENGKTTQNEDDEDHNDDDPFACFGVDDSDDEKDQTPRTAIITPVMARSRHLKQKSNDRTSRANLMNVCVPITSPNYAVFDSISAAGKGLKATKNFVRGEEILRERAAMRIPNQQAASSLEEAEELHEIAVRRGFENLEPATRQAFLELSSCYDEATTDVSIPVCIYQTNSYQLGDDEPYGGLFLTIARLNHSCRPNCHHIWRPDLKEMLLFATRDICEGEELCTTYGPSQCLDTAGRQAYLLERFSFTCGCEMCLESSSNDRDSTAADSGDNRMMKLDALQEDISLMAASGKPEDAIQAIEQSLSLLREQRIETAALVKPLFHHGYQIAMGQMGDKVLARSYLAKELIAVKHSEGIGSPKAMEIQDILDGITIDPESDSRNVQE